eukprot:CAMPEP_0115159406 /NCGR_PEP_ID=MMETSP0227-20121206/70177_1 /TAXON_ID=89957 /ORGANISM="Polarella glacialis, Strain CCMP 1383" /LENGTH=43 /DNA_ID= /DNA_START= /DNA_END= /DNA_ORIENTATION=
MTPTSDSASHEARKMFFIAVALLRKSTRGCRCAVGIRALLGNS